MRRIALALGVATATIIAVPGTATAQSYPWCAIDEIGANCRHSDFSQNFRVARGDGTGCAHDRWDERIVSEMPAAPPSQHMTGPALSVRQSMRQWSSQ